MYAIQLVIKLCHDRVAALCQGWLLLEMCMCSNANRAPTVGEDTFSDVCLPRMVTL